MNPESLNQENDQDTPEEVAGEGETVRQPKPVEIKTDPFSDLLIHDDTDLLMESNPPDLY